MKGLNELEEKINGILNDPEELRKISELARSLMQGQPEPEQTAQREPEADPMLRKLISGLGALRGEVHGGAAMLHAISPYLDEKRSRKLERAIRMSEMARLAGTVLREYGGESFGDK